MLAVLFISCAKEDGTKGNAQAAIDTVQNKNTATHITIPGELTLQDWETIKNIRKQLPNIEDITLSDVKDIEFGVFVYKDGIVHVTNKWLKRISAPKVETVGEAAFWNCEVLETVDFPNAKYLGEEAFCACEKLETLNFPNATTIGDLCFGGCKGLKSLSLGASEQINTSARSFASLNTAGIDLDLDGYEADQAVGKIWKDLSWKSISSNGTEIHAPDFGVANWGSTMEFIENNETGTPVSGGNGSKKIYADKSGNWNTYYFDDDKRLIKGVRDYSSQFGSEYVDAIFRPITFYQSDLYKLKSIYGEPTYKSEDVFSFNMTDKNAITAGYAFAEAQWVMNGFKVFIYTFNNTRTDVECMLSAYTRPGQYLTWGFTITTTYIRR